ncbi:MAG: GxxExxY protein [Sedimentisphaerales bacterium]|nr:GxxExxY protein [Sedimentisphaerales bacterium]
MKTAKKQFEQLSEKEELIASQIVDAAYTVHNHLGPGLLEKIYEVCFCHELSKRNLSYKNQMDIPIIYDGILFNQGLRLDILVEDLIICELKATDQNRMLWEAQLLSYLKLTNKRLGFIINFNVPVIKQGIKRIIL